MAATTAKVPGSLHVVFGATCSNHMDWKSIAAFHSFKTAGWGDNGTSNKITRVMACTDEELKSYRGLDIGPTFTFTDQQTVEGYEDSPTYNKPAGILHFTQMVDIEEEFILYVDADMLFRRAIEPSDFRITKGLVVTEWVWYIQEGIKNGLARQFLPDAASAKRAESTHGGYYHLFHVEDAKRVAPLWLHYTKEIRHHPENYYARLPNSRLKRDIDVKQKGARYGDVPWISEMYGYAFAAAEIGLKHKFTRGGGGVSYGDDFLSLNHDGPFLSHYTLSCRIPSMEIFTGGQDHASQHDAYHFDKNTFRDFDPSNCEDGFLFPTPDTILADEGSASCSENVKRINNALCDFYRRRCPPETPAYYDSIRHCPWNTNAPFTLHHGSVIPAPCGDKNDRLCKKYVAQGKCQSDPAFMQLNCLDACGFCASKQYNDGRHGSENQACKDREDPIECDRLKDELECVLNPTFMVTNCRKTCGKCHLKYTDNDTTSQNSGRSSGSAGFNQEVDARDIIATAICFDAVVFLILSFFVLALNFSPWRPFWRFSHARGSNRKSKKAP